MAEQEQPRLDIPESSFLQLFIFFIPPVYSYSPLDAMMDINTFQPRLRVLSKKQAWAIHTAALEILEKTGFRMEHPEVREMLTEAGCDVDDKGWVTMPAWMAEEAIQSAPRQITLYNQKGEKAM